MFKKTFLAVCAMAVVGLTSCQQPKTENQMENEFAGTLPQLEEFTPTSDVQERIGIFAPFTLSSDISHLSNNEKELVKLLFGAADIMQDLYWQQTIGQKDKFLSSIKDADAKKFAEINYGPWDRLNGNKSFINEIGEKPLGANFYPADMTKEEFEALENPDKTSLYTLIRRDENGKLKVVWFHEAYKEQLTKASDLLKKAAELADNTGLKNYLLKRADALVTSDYQPSDFAWMDMKTSNIDFVVGPIENYEDALFGYKAAFESFILIKDIKWSEKLAKYAALLPDLQRGLPIEDEYKKEIPGSDADINAYDVVYYRGDCNAGSKTIAINLPNDEQVQLKNGSRKLQLKNAMQAKFDKILIPISEMLIHPDQQKYVKFDAFFENTMFHEVGHAMGIKNTINGNGPVRTALKETYSSIEEDKADIMGLYLVTKLYEMGEITEGEVMDNFVTFFAGIFRSSRFGAASAHGKANMMRFNYFAEHGAFTRDADGYYTVNFEKMHQAMLDIMERILHIQGDANYELAVKLIKETGVVMPQLQTDLDRLNASGIPVDIVFEQGPSKLGL
ncbi:MAG: Zn-dependent hydrolase [Bacteroidales bacterium]|nr:Zn-dependent hydrolase [Bacteroidales bacterium]